MDPTTTDLTPFTGSGVFGPAYRRMFEGDTHAPGSVDRVLVQRMVLLCDATQSALYGGFPPAVSGYRAGSRLRLERALAEIRGSVSSPPVTLAAIAAYCHRLQDKVAAQKRMEDWRFGGTEEEIIERGTDWCTDVSRVACILCQVAGFPARLAQLAAVRAAYSGHEVVEAFVDGRWAVMDPLHGLVHRHPGGAPASAWDLARHPGLADPEHRDLYSTIALSNYPVADRDRYDYTVSGVNPYYRDILSMSEQGWPGGLRWLHGEDQA